MLAPHVIAVTARSVAHAVTSAKQVMNHYHGLIRIISQLHDDQTLAGGQR